MGTNNDTAVAATAATATATTTRAAAVMIQQQQLVNINLLFPLLLSNTDISHGGDLKPKEVRSLKPPEVNQILREASQEEGGHGAAKVAMVMRRMSRGYGEEPGFFKVSMNVSAPVQIGKQMTVSCNANRALELCVFKPPFAKKAKMFTPATQLEYGRIRLSERAKGDPKICEILVDKVEKKDLGDWRCVVGCTCYQNEGEILTVTETQDSMAKEVEALKNNMAKEVEALKNNMAKEVKALKNNTVKKTELQENMDSTAKEVEELKKKMVKKTELQENMDRLSRLEKLSQRGAYCGYQRSWTIAYRVITYQKLMLSEGDAGVLDPNTGVFRASVPGLFQINWSLRNYLKGNDDNLIYLHRNRRVIDESEHYSYITRTASSSQVIGEMGGRTMLLRLGAGDTLYLRTSNFQGGAIRIQFCVMLLAAE